MHKIDEIIDRCVSIITENQNLLTKLDQAIGDGDHGLNLKRGFDAVAKQKPELVEMPLGKALQSAGMKLVMTIGGASGPLYGSLLMSMGKNLVDNPQPKDLVLAFEAGVKAVESRGKSGEGQKTMLDVLVPASRYLREHLNDDNLCRDLIAQSQIDLERTKEMLASKGRASFLGERSIGHLDPGAYSSMLLIKAVCSSEKK